ncbi:MAG: acetyl-CoA carboxylase biotin carboxyl carrier protein [Thermoanaerobaculia bacterium]
MLTFEQIKELIDLVSERQLQGLEIERAGFRIKIEGRAPAPAVVTVSEPAANSPASRATVEAPAAKAEEPEPQEETADASEEVPVDGHLLKSPIVGTFYTSTSPDSDPYVQVGDSVKKGQVLCIVEAMKLMNEIESDVDGVIDEIYPQNAQPVEFGEPLFLIRTG